MRSPGALFAVGVPIAKTMTVSAVRNKLYRTGEWVMEFIVYSVFIILGGWFCGSLMF